MNAEYIRSGYGAHTTTQQPEFKTTKGKKMEGVAKLSRARCRQMRRLARRIALGSHAVKPGHPLYFLQQERDKFDQAIEKMHEAGKAVDAELEIVHSVLAEMASLSSDEEEDDFVSRNAALAAENDRIYSASLSGPASSATIEKDERAAAADEGATQRAGTPAHRTDTQRDDAGDRP